MKKMKRFVSALLAICLIVVMIPVTVSAATSGTCGENLTWTLSDDGVLTISGTGPMTDFDNDYYEFTPWYNSSSSIKSLVIENGVTSIGNYAFEKCHALTSVTIPNSVTYIGDSAFYFCSALTNLNIGTSVTYIGEFAFDYCKALTRIDIPDSVTYIGDAAFIYCEALTSVTIGKGVTSMGAQVFGYCDSLTEISVSEKNTSYSSDSHGVLFNKDKTELIQAPGGYQGHYSIPDTVTSISDHAFCGCGALTSVTIPESVTSIGNSAFESCSALTCVTINNSIISIADYAFKYCYALTNASLGNNVTSIGNFAFYYCESLTSVNIPDSVTSIGNYAFDSCRSLTNVVIGNGVTSIGTQAFGHCSSLTSVTIGDSVSSIGFAGFAFCNSLTEITFLGKAPSIGSYAFSDVTATAYYPKNNSTWTSSVLKDYGGKLTWVSYGVTQPEAPTIKASNIASTGKIKVTWDKVEGAEKYKVYRATSKTGTYKLMKTVTGTSFTNTSVDAGKTYYYYVRAVDVDGKTSDKSNIVSRTCDLAQPELTMSNVASSGKIKVSWKAIDGAVEYEVYRATSKSGTYSKVKTTTSLSYKDTKATSGKTYYYKVIAVASKSAANSAYSSVVSIKSK